MKSLQRMVLVFYVDGSEVSFEKDDAGMSDWDKVAYYLQNDADSQGGTDKSHLMNIMRSMKQ